MFTSWMATDLYCCRYLRLAGKNCTTRVLIMFKDYLYSLHYDKANPMAEHLKMSEENPKSRVYLLNDPPTCRSTYFRLTQANGKKMHNSGCWSHQKAPHSLLLRQGKFHGWTFEREWRGSQAPRLPPEWPLTCRSTYFRLTQATGKKVHNLRQEATHSLLWDRANSMAELLKGSEEDPKLHAHLLNGHWLVAHDESAHDDVLQQHQLERGQQGMCVQHCRTQCFCCLQCNTLPWTGIQNQNEMEQSTWVHILQTICNRH